MKIKLTLNIIVLLLTFSVIGLSKPRVEILNGNNPISFNPPGLGQAIAIQRVLLGANQIGAWFQNTGIMDQDTRTQNTPGFEWPKGSGKFANFTAGLSIGCHINGQLAQVMASYSGEYTPGYTKFDAGSQTYVGYTDADFKLYSVKSGDNANTNPDYANWGKMVPYGAPYVDINENGQYDPAIDIPGQKDAGQTLFLAMTDAFVEQRNAGEGFGGGVTSPLLYADLRMTAWAYNSPGLEDLQFVKWTVMNNGGSDWENTYISVVVDPDLGDAGDDYIGCDTNLNLGYVYNGNPNDGTGAGNTYGAAPPSYGMDYFSSPIIRATNDTLGLTSFVFFTNNGSSPPPCESDPNGEPLGAYNMMTGVKKDETPFIDITTNTPTKFVYPGDPESQSGWTEFAGAVQNCNGALTGPTVTPNPPGDRRFIFNSGSDQFTMSPGDTQELVLAKFITRGGSYTNSVTKLKGLSKTAQLIYDNDFNVTPPPPTPKTVTSITPLVNGTCNITLMWEANAETYSYWDTLFFDRGDSNIYSFEGYEVYEVNRFASQLPNLSQPESINDDIKLLYAYDLKNNIGTIFDTFSVGGDPEVFSAFPIVPPYTMASPSGFPNSGLNRSVTISRTSFPENYGGRTELIYGQEYQFIVVAYAVSKIYNNDSLMKRGFKTLRNSLSSSIIKIIPTAPPAGTEYTFANGDTLNTNRRDLGVKPVILGQDLMKDAKYKVLFMAPDTSYGILRSMDNGASYDTLVKNLRTTLGTSQDSARVIDGVLINVKSIKSNLKGVIRDLTATAGPDSIQSRFGGWDYTPSNNRNLEGAVKFRPADYQSIQMGLVYPSTGFYTNVGSTVKPDELLPTEIEFTDGTGQKAYRFIADTSESNFDNFYIYDKMIDVPFKVYEVNSDLGTRRQLNVAIVNSKTPGANPPMQEGFTPTADSLGGKVFVYIFKSDYSPNPDPSYTSKNLFLSVQVDISYVWAPKLIAGNSPAFTPGDKLTIYPYTVTKPGVSYEFVTKAPLFANNEVATTRNDLEKIRVVPNPYYGFSDLDRSLTDRFVTFRHLPATCTIKIYTLNGDLIKTLNKEAGPNVSTSSTIEWNMTNQDNSPVASGIYIALIDAPGIGQKVEKIVIFTAQERINF